MDNLNIGRHISGQFNEDLERIINHVMHMGGLVEKQLTDALTSVCDADEELAKKVLNNDYQINNAEVSIDDECTRIIAKRQPAAGLPSCKSLTGALMPHIHDQFGHHFYEP